MTHATYIARGVGVMGCNRSKNGALGRGGLGAKLLGIIMNLYIIYTIHLYKITMKTIECHIGITTWNMGLEGGG